MADIRKTGDRLRNLGKRIETNVDRLVRRCALAVDATVVLATPVDTGRARANWQVEVNGAAQGTTDSVSRSGREAIDQGKAKIETYKGGTANASLHITNNLPYIGRLNDGWSAQAPVGFVEKAVTVGLSAIKGVSVTSSRVDEEGGA